MMQWLCSLSPSDPRDLACRHGKPIKPQLACQHKPKPLQACRRCSDSSFHFVRPRHQKRGPTGGSQEMSSICKRRERDSHVALIQVTRYLFRSQEIYITSFHQVIFLPFFGRDVYNGLGEWVSILRLDRRWETRGANPSQIIALFTE